MVAKSSTSWHSKIDQVGESQSLFVKPSACGRVWCPGRRRPHEILVPVVVNDSATGPRASSVRRAEPIGRRAKRRAGPTKRRTGSTERRVAPSERRARSAERWAGHVEWRPWAERPTSRTGATSEHSVDVAVVVLNTHPAGGATARRWGPVGVVDVRVVVLDRCARLASPAEAPSI